MSRSAVRVRSSALFVKMRKVVDNVMRFVHLWCIAILLRHLLPQFR
jgi:hypothetical protein